MELAAAVIVMLGGAQGHPEMDAAAAGGSVNLAFLRAEDAQNDSGAGEEGEFDGNIAAAVISLLRQVDRFPVMRMRLIVDATTLAAKLKERVSTSVEILVDSGDGPHVQLDRGTCTVFICTSKCTSAAEAAIRQVRSDVGVNLLCCARVHQQRASYRPTAPVPAHLEGVIPPRQSVEMVDGKHVQVSERPAIAMCYWRSGRTRVDRCQSLELDEVRMKAGCGPVLLEHVLAEIAFQIGCAPKYGA